jgi:serine/threonine protein kinase
VYPRAADRQEGVAGLPGTNVHMESEQVEVRAKGRLGSVLRGKYRLDSVIGVGGMAVVYKALHRNQAEFAVKMLHPELSLNDNIRSRFLREGYAANSVKHSGVVLVVDDDVAEDGSAFLVMELLSGLTADDAWTALGGKIPLDAACAIAVELLDVLAAAHDKGILHRDIKPANVFVTREGVLKVLDFGIARVRDSMAGNSQATGTGMLLGTPAFMAPEQVIGKPTDVDTRVDLWAVGATIFNLVSGQMVHEAETGPQLMVKLATQPPRSLYAVVPDAPPAIAAVVDRALAFDKNLRWQTAGEMEEALRVACVQAFGDFVPRNILARLVATAKPQAGRSAVRSPSGARPAAPAPFGTPAPVAAPAGTGIRAITGASPVSTSTWFAQEHAGGGASASRKGVIGIVAGLAALSAVGITVALMHRGAPSPPRAAPAASVSDPSVPQNPSPRAAPPAAAPTDPPAVAVVAPAAALPPLEPARQEPAAAARHPGAALGGGRATTAREAGAPAREASGKPNCNPPYTLDQNGEKHFKPECF